MKMNKKALAILSAAHMVTDVNQGALPALLPLFKDALNLSYTTAGIILLFSNLTSSVIQPAFGYFSDRYPRVWILPLAPFVACAGLSLTGIIPSYSLLLICVVISGIGVASFHPEGYKTAHFFTGETKATGMSIFSVGGNLGMALGPTWALALITSFGLKGTLGLGISGVLMTFVLYLSITWLATPVRSAFTQTEKEKKEPISKDQKLSLFLLISTVVVRSWVQMGLVTYIPFYYIDYLKESPLHAGKLVSTFLMAGAVGTLIGSPFADRWGHKRFLLVSMISAFPLLLLFYNSGGIFAFVVLGITGMVLISSFSVTVVMGQSLLPHHLGMASGLMVGFAIGAGGVGVTLLGTIADIWGVPAALKSIFLLPLIGAGLCLLIKYPSQKIEG